MFYVENKLPINVFMVKEFVISSQFNERECCNREIAMHLCDGEISAKMTQHINEEEAKVFINDYFFDQIDG